MLKNILISYFLFIALVAESAIISGKIVDHNGKILPEVRVVVNNQMFFSITDGNISIPDLQVGMVSLVITSNKYQPYNVDIKIDTINQIVDLGVIQLTLAPIELDSVLVTGNSGSKNSLERMSEIEGTMVFAGKKNEVIMLSNLNANVVQNNARQVFAKVPGVMVWENEGSGLQINVATRGLSPNRSWEFNTRQNGYDISSDIMGYPEAYYSPPLEAVEKIQIVRGAASLQYGSQFGGLLNYVIKKGNPLKPVHIDVQQTLGNYGLFNSFVAAGGTVNKINYYSFYNNRSGDGWRPNGKYNTQTGYLNLNYKLNNRLSLGYEATYMEYKSQQSGGLTDRMFAQNPQQSIRSRNWLFVPWFLQNINVDYIVNSKIKLNLKIFGLIGERSSVGFVQGVNIPDSINLATRDYNARQTDRQFFNNVGLEARMLSNYSLFGKEHTLAVGIRWANNLTKRNLRGLTNQDIDFGYTNEASAYRDELTFRNINYAVFAENIFRLGDRFTVTPGLRYEIISSTINGKLSNVQLSGQNNQRSFLLAGLGLEFKITDGVQLYSNFSQNYRPVESSQLTPSSPTDSVSSTLKDGIGYNVDLGFRGSMRQWLQWDLGVFYLYYDNRIGLINVTKPNGNLASMRTNIGTSESKGVEAYLEIDPLAAFIENSMVGNISFFASMAYIQAKYIKWDVPNSTVRPGNYVEYAPNYINRFGATYKKSNFSVTYQLNSVAGTYSDAANTTVSSSNGQNGWIPSYQVMDISATYDFLKRFSVKLNVNNLLDQKYFTRRASGYPGPGLMPADGRLYSITVSIKL